MTKIKYPKATQVQYGMTSLGWVIEGRVDIWRDGSHDAALLPREIDSGELKVALKKWLEAETVFMARIASLRGSHDQD